MSQFLDQALPNSADSERAVLGAVLVNNAVMAEAVSLLTVRDFYVPSHQRIYAAMIALYDRDEEIDAILVHQELSKTGIAESVGGISAITNLTIGMPSFSRIGQYASQVVRTAKRRRLVALGNEIIARAMDTDDSEEQIAEWIDQEVTTFRATTAERQGPKAVEDLIEAQLSRFERFHHNISDSVPTGFEAIDGKMTGGGLVRGFSHILAARPSMGKTSLMLDMAENAAADGFLVYVATLEMTNPILLDRLFAVRAGVPRWQVSPGMTDRTLAKLQSVSASFAGQSLVIDNSSRSLSDIRRAVRDTEKRFKRPVDLMIVDYLQLMRTEKGGTRNDQVGSNSRGLQEMAKEFNCAGLFLSQLSRAPEQSNREPELSDLRDSGEIEQDARAVFFLFGDKSEETPGMIPPTYREIVFKCSKQGEGPLFRTPLPFNTQLVTFRSFSQAVAPLQYTGSNNTEGIY